MDAAIPAAKRAIAKPAAADGWRCHAYVESAFSAPAGPAVSHPGTDRGTKDLGSAKRLDEAQSRRSG